MANLTERFFFVARMHDGDKGEVIELYHRPLGEDDGRPLRNRIDPGVLRSGYLECELGDVILCHLIDRKDNGKIRYWTPVHFEPMMREIVVPQSGINNEDRFEVDGDFAKQHAGERWFCTPIKISRNERIVLCPVEQSTGYKVEKSGRKAILKTMSGNRVLSERVFDVGGMDEHFAENTAVKHAAYEFTIDGKNELIIKVDYSALGTGKEMSVSFHEVMNEVGNGELE